MDASIFFISVVIPDADNLRSVLIHRKGDNSDIGGVNETRVN